MSYSIKNKSAAKVLSFSPLVAWNNYDKTQVGLAIYTPIRKHYDLTFLPMYGTASKTMSGILKANFRIYSDGEQLALMGLEAKRFSYLLFPNQLEYNKLKPFATFLIPSKKEHTKYAIGVKSHLIQHQVVNFENKIVYNRLWFNEFMFETNTDRALFSLRAQPRLIFNGQMVQGETTFNIKLKYKKPANSFHIRLFAAYLKRNNTLFNFYNPVIQLSGSANNGFYFLQKDYTYNELFLDRNGVDPFFGRQVTEVDGGFKSLTAAGNATQFLTALNLSSDVMISEKVQRYCNIQPFVAMAVVKQENNDEIELYAEGGFTLSLFKDMLQFHFPMVTTNNISLNQRTAYGIEKNQIFQKTTFSLRLDQIKNWKTRYD